MRGIVGRLTWIQLKVLCEGGGQRRGREEIGERNEATKSEVEGWVASASNLLPNQWRISDVDFRLKLTLLIALSYHGVSMNR